MLNPGTKLGLYEILAPLGAGGMGEVYRAKDTKLHREVAIKVLPADVASSPERLQRFEREATTVAALNHPNIVTIFGIEESDGHRFIAMELVEGETLDRMISPGGMPLTKIFDIAIPLADALAAAHAKGIVHRDLKPANVMVTKEGRVKVLDFGLAKLTAAGQGDSSPDDVTLSAPLTGRGVVMGTVPYMSPEQLNGEDLDHRTDLFSFGIMLYEMATGQRPFKGKTSASITSSILRDAPRPVQELNSVLPRHLGRIIERCLAKDPEQRLQSAKDIRNDLRALLKEVDSGSELSESQPVSIQTIVSTPPSSTSSVPSGSAMSAPTRRGEFWIGVGVLAVTVTLAAWWLGRHVDAPGRTAMTNAPSATTPSTSDKPSVSQDSQERPDVRTTLAILPFENISTDPDTEYLSNEIPANIIDKLSGLSGLSVISRSGAFRFDPSEEGANDFGKSLGASVVLTGQLNARGNSLTIRAELVDVATNWQLWNKRYARQLTDIMAVEADITQNISEALRLQLTQDDRTKLAKRYTTSAEAHRALLEGRFWRQKFTTAGWRKALGHFQDAVRLDPAYALAYAELSKAYSGLGIWFGDMPPAEAAPKAKRTALRAIALDESLGSAHGALAFNRMFYDWDWSGSEDEFIQAIRLAPESGRVRLHYSILLRLTGRLREAEEEIRASLLLDPTFPMSFVDLGYICADTGRYAEAIEECRKALDLDKDFPPAYLALGIIHLAKGEYVKAISYFERNSEYRNRQSVDLGYLGAAYAMAGERAKATAILEELKGISSKGRGKAAAAMIHAGLGDADSAFAALEQAYRKHEPGLVFFNLELPIDALRGDPRFDDLLRRMRLEPDSKSVSSTVDTRKKTMLAVLPFTNLSGDPEQEYFSDGMTEEMITRLGRLRPELLGVIARTSAMRYKKTDKTIDQIGRELGVAYVIEGGVRRAGDSVRISAQLIQVSDQTQLWGDSYTRDLSDVFAVQAEVAEAVAKSLAVELLPQEESGPAKPPTESSAAYDAYLLGRSYWAKRTPESLHSAIDHFKRAIKLDPNYALAYSGLADTWNVMPWYVPGPYNEINAEANKAAETAFALDDSLAETHASMAELLQRQGDWDTAFEHYRKALEIDPNNATAHQWYGQALGFRGRFDEGALELERSITLDPLSAVMRLCFGTCMRLARRWDLAIEQLSKALELQPNLGGVGTELTLAYLGKHDHVKAAAAFVGFLTTLGQPPNRIERFRKANETMGIKGALIEWLNSFHGEDSLPYGAATHAELLAWCGEKDRAFEWLERAVRQQDPYLLILETSHGFDNLRNDPRWADLRRKTGFPKIEIPDPSSTP